MKNEKVKSAKAMIDLCWNLTLIVAVFMCATISADSAFATATNGGAIQQVFCNLVDILTSATGRAIATVAVIAVGIGALLGKISWGMALIVAVGIALIFGAGSIVSVLASGGGLQSGSSC